MSARPARRRVAMLFAALCGLVLAGAAADVEAHSYKLGDIAIGHIWASPPADDATGLAVYGPLLNNGETTAALVGASSPVAEEVKFRRVKDGDVTWPKALELAPGQPLAMAAWREHIWLQGLKRRLDDGDSFPVTLDFGAAGTLQIEVMVESGAAH